MKKSRVGARLLPRRLQTAGPPLCFSASLAAFFSARRRLKKSDNWAEHASASTPPVSSTLWLWRGSCKISNTEPAAPVLRSRAPETTRLLWPLVAAELAHRRRRQRQRRALLAAAGLLLLMVLSLAAWQAFSITLGGL